MADDLSQRLWREGARSEGEIEQLRRWRDRHRDCSATEQMLDEYQDKITDQIAMIEQIQDMLSYLDLHMKQWPIDQLTTVEKELYADLVDAGSRRAWEQDVATDHNDPEDQPRRMDRWWR
jgi:hypothetical protein